MGEFMADCFPIFNNHILHWERKHGANAVITAIDIIHAFDIMWVTERSSHLIRKTNTVVYAVYIWAETQSERVKADGQSQGNLSSAVWQLQSQSKGVSTRWTVPLLQKKKKKNTWEIIFEEETPANHCY